MSAYTVYSTHIQYTVWQKGFKICIRWRNKKLNKSPDIGQTWSAAWHESYILYVKTKFTKLLYSYFAYSRRCGIAHQTSKEEVTGSYPASPIMIRDAAGKTRRASPWRRKNIFWGNDSNEVAKWSEHRTAGRGSRIWILSSPLPRWWYKTSKQETLTFRTLLENLTDDALCD